MMMNRKFVYRLADFFSVAKQLSDMLSYVSETRMMMLTQMKNRADIQ